MWGVFLAYDLIQRVEYDLSVYDDDDIGESTRKSAFL